MTRDEYISSNLQLVHSCANKFRGRGIEYDDLFSAGCLGLVKAADGFREELGFRFSTYAVPVILGEIKRLFRDGGAVKVSRSLKEKARTLTAEKEKLENELGREATLSELAEHMEIDISEVAELLNITMYPISLTSTDENGERQVDIPVDSDEEHIQNAVAINEVLSTLEDRDRKLIELRYFSGFTQSVTAEKLGLSQVQVSRREKVLLLDMRKKMTG